MEFKKNPKDIPVTQNINPSPIPICPLVILFSIKSTNPTNIPATLSTNDKSPFNKDITSNDINPRLIKKILISCLLISCQLQKKSHKDKTTLSNILR